jgi:hypothetical protein
MRNFKQNFPFLVNFHPAVRATIDSFTTEIKVKIKAVLLRVKQSQSGGRGINLTTLDCGNRNVGIQHKAPVVFSPKKTGYPFM